MTQRPFPRRRTRVLLAEAWRRLGYRRWRLPAPADFDADLESKGDHYWVFQKMQRSLARNRAGHGLRVGFQRLGAGAESMARIDHHLGRMAIDRNGAVLGLYGELMRLHSLESVLVGYLRRALGERLELADADPGARGHVYAWPVAHLLDAALVGYERTGSVAFSELAAGALDWMAERRDDSVGRRDEVRGRVVAAWGGNRFVPGRHTVNVTAVGRVAEPYARFAAVSPEHRRAPRFAAIAAETLGELDDEYREQPDGAGWYPVLGGDRSEPLNHLAAAGSAWAELHRATEDPKALRRSAGLARFVRSTWYRDRRGCMVWDYDPDPISRRGRGTEFVWKAIITLGFLRRAAAAAALDASDVTEACRTLRGNVFREGRVNATIYRRYVPIEIYGTYHGGLQSVMALMANSADCPHVVRAIEEAVAARPAAGGWLDRPQGAIGYAARLSAPAPDR